MLKRIAKKVRDRFTLPLRQKVDELLALTGEVANRVEHQADRTRRAVAEQADRGPRMVAELTDLTRQTVADHAEQVRAAVAGHTEHTRRAVAELTETLTAALAEHTARAGEGGEQARAAVAEHAEHMTAAMTGLAAAVQAALAGQAERLGEAAAGQADLTRQAVTGQADVTRRAVAEQGEVTRRAVAEHAATTAAAAAEQADLTRRAIAEQADLTRRAANEAASATAADGWDRWKRQEVETLVRHLRRREYLAAIRAGELDVPRLTTDHPLAADSNDTKHPRGAKNDNSIRLRFNHKLAALVARPGGARVLDLGCAGGGFVRTLLDDGHFAVGLDGSDYPLVNQTGEWGTVPRHLLTCDVTRPFALASEATGEPLRFDAVTAWEVLEHIPEDRLAGLLANVGAHLAPGGYFIASVATFVDRDDETGVVWHVTVKPPEWWAGRFAAAGFAAVADHPFGPEDWVRGGGNGRHDEHYAASGRGFHVVLRRRADG